MTHPMWTRRALNQMAALGIDPLEASRQLSLFKSPPPFAHLDRPASLGDGILKLSNGQVYRALQTFEKARRQGRFLKFVPASGAASRMFFLISKFLKRPSLTRADLRGETLRGDKDSQQLLDFVEALPRSAFWGDLEKSLKKGGLEAVELLRAGKFHELLTAVLQPEGLNYLHKPKGLIKFHAYDHEDRTPVEEQLVEAAHYVKDASNRSRIHFTISPGHARDYRGHLRTVQGRYGKKRKVRFRIGLSAQKSSTGTLAVDLKNQPFRDKQGCLVFRPAGHGALIENLNQLKGDVVFIKNIDNVVMEHHLDTTVHWKKVLGGILVDLQQKAHGHLRRIHSGHLSPHDLKAMEQFLARELSIPLDGRYWKLSMPGKVAYLRHVLDRPIRVCGVVPNRGEVGGGPFWVRDSKGIISLQIVESAQVDMGNVRQRKLFQRSTHFNPVDLVCGLRNWKGEPFDLKNYVDPKAVFISRKSFEGRELKALELPGLWNGAMADWITLFVEVPLETFNPVKTVFDLFKPRHRAKV